MKTVTVLLTAVMLMCCNVKSNSGEGRLYPERGKLYRHHYGNVEDVSYGGMRYTLYTSVNGGVGFTNITKDSLECELLKKELLK